MMKNYIPPIIIIEEIPSETDILVGTDYSIATQGLGNNTQNPTEPDESGGMSSTDGDINNLSKMGDFPWDDEFEYHIDM